MNDFTASYRNLFLEGESGFPGFATPAIRSSRRASLQRFLELGFPTQFLENWKYTSVRALSRTLFKPPKSVCMGLVPEDLDAFLPESRYRPRLVFVNGFHVPSLSDLGKLPSGVRVVSMARLANESPGEITAALGREVVAEPGFTSWNQAFWPDGAFVRVSAGARLDAPLHLLFLTTPSREAQAIQPWNRIVVEAEARLQLVESYVTLGMPPHLSNARTDLLMGRGARVDHLLRLDESTLTHHSGRMDIRQEASSQLDSRLFCRGGALTRQEVCLNLNGQGAACRLDGLFMAEGRQHMDFQTRIHHQANATRSRQLFKGVLDGESRGVFHGVIQVPPGVRDTESRQRSANLLLSDQAEIDTLPQLEIFNDAVQCAHGASVGHVDQEAMFYLRSRGLKESEARRLLVEGFAEEVLQDLEPLSLRDWLRRQLGGLCHDDRS
ncbi:MAG: Fe-S cluster assembly protein SufD [Magnetococcales bacterium]|nr:Fe-S cluster assembly protein SufD [Magnetococcales bacterium]